MSSNCSGIPGRGVLLALAHSALTSIAAVASAKLASPKQHLEMQLLPLLTPFLSVALSSAAPTAERPPNIVLFFIDNLGNGDIGCFGSKLHRTPHLDQLAVQGTKFTSFYVASGVCTPSRAALLTGCYPRRVNMHASGTNTAVLRAVDPKGLHPDETTIAEVLK